MIVADDLDESVPGRVIGAEDRVLRLQVLGGEQRPDEDMRAVVIAAVEQSAEDRVVKGLGQFRLPVLGQQAQVLHLDPPPQPIVAVMQMELATQDGDGLHHPSVVEVDAFPGGGLDRRPVGALEALPCAGGDLPEQPEVASKPSRMASAICFASVQAMVSALSPPSVARSSRGSAPPGCRPRPRRPSRRGRSVTPAKVTGRSRWPSPRRWLLRGMAASALMPRSMPARSSVSRTQPNRTTPAQPWATALAAIRSPSMAQRREPPASATSTRPAPGSARHGLDLGVVLEALDGDHLPAEGAASAEVPEDGLADPHPGLELVVEVGGLEGHGVPVPAGHGQMVAKRIPAEGPEAKGWMSASV